MYILLYSIVISAFVLGAYQYIDSINRDTNAEPYDITKELFTINNVAIYMAIVSSVFFVLHMAFNDDADIFATLGIFENDKDNTGYEIKKTSVNPNVLRNATDPMKMGFEPYNSGGSKSDTGTDASSVSSSDCSVDSDD
jgi:hypothetical protein|uniref:Uncharacterized protein n=1 Tax=viral metagenome TaxID=1070528 RepID=A0A6C0CFL2_9ZZZZ